MDYSWFNTSWTALLMVLLSTVGIYIALILFTRLFGLRSFTKMSSFDFGITIAIGAVIGATILSPNPPLFQAVAGLGALYAVQMLVGYLRGKSKWISKLVDNKPLLLMDGENILYDNLKEAKVTHDDLCSKLRGANVTQLNQVKAVVMETSGDISVLHHEEASHELEKAVMTGVQQ